MSFRPDWASPPGATLLEMLDQRGWTQARLARETGVTPKHINFIVHGRAGINPELAIRLEDAGFGAAAFWVRRDADYRLARARIAETEREEKA